MEKFARIVVGYHGCTRTLANDLLTEKLPISQWDKSENAYDWLGERIYFWEHSPTRALRWATEGFRKRAAVVGAVIQLGTLQFAIWIAFWGYFAQTLRRGDR